jgi:hypothetical protein
MRRSRSQIPNGFTCLVGLLYGCLCSLGCLCREVITSAVFGSDVHWFVVCVRWGVCVGERAAGDLTGTLTVQRLVARQPGEARSQQAVQDAGDRH